MRNPSQFSLPLLIGTIFFGCFVLGSGLLAPTRTLAAPQKLILDPEAGTEVPTWEVTQQASGSITVRLHLPALDVEEVTADGMTFQAMTLADGGIDGQPGEPGLPTLSRFLAVPPGVNVENLTASIVTREDVTLASYRLLPVQPDGVEEFIFDPEAYTATSPVKTERNQATVSLGEPAYIRHLQVVPVTFRPVAFDAARGEITVTRQLEVSFEFGAAKSSVHSVIPAPRFIPESFDRVFQEQILGYERGESEVGPGTYLMICVDNASVVQTLEPLLDWRRELGYHVELATTTQTGTTTTAIKQFIQEYYDTAQVPLEYVTIAGDASGSLGVVTWRENLSGYHGEGDHYYTLLSGGDVLADAHIGRLSFATLGELQIIVDKILNYETAPPTDDPGWFTRASLTGDPGASGITTIYVNQWLKNQLLSSGYTQVDTIWGGDFSSQMMANLNQGCSVFGYRGFLNMSGLYGSHISSSSNGGMLPFAVIVTCDTGSFLSDGACRSERFLRAANGGGIASVGTATTGTHTRYNNCYYHGVWNGVLNSEVHRFGVAHTLGKLELYKNYQLSEPSNVEIWSVWNNLMGDPVTEMWTALPAGFEVEHPATLPVGANAVPLTVTSGLETAAEARVSLYKAGEVLVSGYTDAQGQVILPLAAVTAGGMTVTVSKHNHQPYRGGLNLGSVAAFPSVSGVQIHDDGSLGSSGNGDGLPGPGETLALAVALTNHGTGLVSDVSAFLKTNDPYVAILEDKQMYGTMSAGETVWSNGVFIVTLDPGTPDGHEPSLELVASDTQENWISLVPLTVQSAAFSHQSHAWSGSGGDLDPGESGNLTVELRNVGSLPAVGITATLSTSSPWITVTDADGTFSDAGVGQAVVNSLDPFVLEVSSGCFQGHLASFTLILQFDGLTVTEVEFQVPVGTADSQDPLGPDAYGYYAFDNTDTEYPFAPTYEWIEIDPNFGGNGTSVELTDFGYEQDDTQVVDLPFTFHFYGQDYDQISICSNGWIAMGVTYLKHYRNWSMPCAGAPDAMIAAFWDDLYQASTNQVYSWYDEDNLRYIIQWSRMRNKYTGALQNFELILYHPVQYPTASGDGRILIQYEMVGNTDSRNGYATVGIHNQDRTDGLTYSYWNQYPAAAAPLTTGRAVLFMPVSNSLTATCEVNPAAFEQTLQPDQTATAWLHIGNNGEPGSVLHYLIQRQDPNYPTTGGGPVVLNLAGSEVTANLDEYIPGSTVDVVFTVTCSSPDNEWIITVQLDFPPGVVVNTATSLTGGGGGPLAFGGDLGDGATVSWNGGWGGGFLANGDLATAEVNLSFDGVVGDIEIPWTLIGDLYGSPPHLVTGNIGILQSGPAVRLLSPNGGEAWAIGEERQITFTAPNGPEWILIELQREPGGVWETLAADVPAGDGGLTWTVTGPVTAQAMMRATDQQDPSLTDTSNEPFTIYRSLDWVQLSEYEGTLAQGEIVDIEVDFDASGLPEDIYEAELIVINSAGDPVVVPVTLTVTDLITAVNEELPTVLTLKGNHPNPFNPRTTIGFALPAAANVQLEVYTLEGKRVAVLVERNLPAGQHQTTWDGRDTSGHQVASGIYFYRLQAGEEVRSGKMVLMK